MWGGSDDICGSRVDTSGTVLDTEGIAICTASNAQNSPSVAFDGTNYLAVWQDYRNGDHNSIYGTYVSQSGTVLDTSDIPIGAVVKGQSYPSVAFDGTTNYLAVWGDYRNSSGDIYGGCVSQSGTVLDTGDIVISTAANPQNYPSVVFDGANYLVVWDDYRGSSYDIYGIRVSQSGTVIDTGGITVSIASSSQGIPSVAFDGTNYLVVWQDYRSSHPQIYGTRVDMCGVVLDIAGIAICTASNAQNSPSVAFSGTNYLVVWQDYRNDTYDIYGTRVDTSGTVLDTAGIAICTASNAQNSPSVAFSGTNYLIVWQDYRNDTYDIYGTRVDTSGTVLDTEGIAICTASNAQNSPSVAFDGTNYLVVWEDKRNGSSDTYGALISQFGTLVDSFCVSTQSGDQCLPSLAAGADRQILITYLGWADYVNDKQVNTMRVWGKFYPFTGIEEKKSKIRTQKPKLEILQNPFAQSTVIKYYLSAKSRISLKIYDVAGRRVKTLVNKEEKAGYYNVKLNAEGLGSGIYFIKLVVGDYKETKKLILVR